MARKCSSWIFCLSSSLGIYFGITIFFLFTFVYHNNYAGIWGLISGNNETRITSKINAFGNEVQLQCILSHVSAVFAGLCLHLHLLSSDNRLSGKIDEKGC